MCYDGLEISIVNVCVYFRYFMALVQEMAVKIDQGFLGAILAVFTPAADPQADRQKVEQSRMLMVQIPDT